MNLKLVSIPDGQYDDYRTEVIFKAYKWDPQVNDQNTIAKYILILSKGAANELGSLAERLSRETLQMEKLLVKNYSLAKELGLPKKILKTLPLLKEYNQNKNIRLMRFDFHPADSGWAVSEVNSDVPGGLAEASVLPEIASKYANARSGENTALKLLEAFADKIKKNGTVAFVHATAYSDDRQVMQFLGDFFNKHGFNSIYAAPDHIKWINKKAHSIIKGQEGEIDGIARFFPLEWLVNMPRRSKWQGFYESLTLSCNHPIAIFAQSKRLPLIWDSLRREDASGIDISVWKKLLPQTLDPKSKKNINDSWIYKPALGRVGEGISIAEVVSQKEMAKIKKAVKKHPKDWIIQKRFKSIPVLADNGREYHLCIGVFTVDGKNAGFYGRISPYPRIDSNAIDIPILIEN